MVLETHCVLLKKPDAFDPLALAKGWAEIRHMPLTDAVHQTRRFWGIVAEGLNEPSAQKLAQELEKLNLPAMAISNSRVVTSLPPARLVRKIDVRDQELVFDGGEADLQRIPWGKLGVLAAGAIKHTVTLTRKVETGPSTAQKMLNVGIFMATGLPLKLGGSKHTEVRTREESDQLFYLDIVAADRSARWRIDAKDIDYSYLKERKLYQGFGNFKLLLCDFIQKSMSAWINRGARMLKNSEPVRLMGYETLADLERETRWLLTLRGLA